MLKNLLNAGLLTRIARLFRTGLWWKIPILLALFVVAILATRGSSTSQASATTFEVRRGPLEITVLEGGTIEAIESQEINSEIQGQTKILTIVDEGTSITEEDVENGRVLVELDSSELEEKLTQQKIVYLSAAAEKTQAQEQYEIQVKENQSDIRAAELEAKFALMDFQKYVGSELAERILNKVELPTIPVLEEEDISIEVDLTPEDDASFAQNNPDTPNGQQSQEEMEPVPMPQDDETATSPVTGEVASTSLDIDFAQFVHNEAVLGGEAKQKKRQLESERLLAEEELSLAQTNLEGTQELFDKNFETQTALDNDKMQVLRREIGVEAAKTSEELYLTYEFPKQAEKLISDYAEALNRISRARKQARAKLAQAQARLESSKATYNLQRNRLNELEEQITKCVLKAEKPGMVAYAGSNDPWRQNERIEEGATVRERQGILTIPDLSKMGVTVSIHESAIQRIAKGQKARISVEARPERVLTGEVVKVAVLPDSGQRWLNPDLKQFPVKVAIDGSYDWLKPGMSAQVDIIVEQIDDTLYVPIQAVANKGGMRVCYVLHGDVPEERPVDTGQYNEQFIAIREGLNEGERVFLRTPVGFEKEEEPEIERKEEIPQEQSVQTVAHSS
jgi:HlyD family secretion protein